MVWPAIAAVAAQLGQSGMSMWQQNRTNKRAQSFAAKMSGTAYQRTMEDMRLAGLNPILAYQQGGASTQAPNITSPGGLNLGGAVSSALAVNRTNAEVDRLEAETKNLGVNEALLEKQLDKTAWEADSARSLSEHNAAVADQAVMLRDWLKTPEGRKLWVAKMIGESLAPAVSSARSVFGTLLPSIGPRSGRRR